MIGDHDEIGNDEDVDEEWGRSLKIEDFYNRLIKMNRTYFEWFTIFEELKLIFPTSDLKSVIDKCFN